MRRREFITLLGGLAARPRITHAQAPMKPPTIGFLGSATPLAWSHWIEALRQQLRKLGWIENRTVFIEYRWAEGRDDRLAEFVAEFVRQKVALFVAPATAAALAAKRATSVIPVVFVVAGDWDRAGCESDKAGWQYHWPYNDGDRFRGQAARVGHQHQPKEGIACRIRRRSLSSGSCTTPGET